MSKIKVKFPNRLAKRGDFPGYSDTTNGQTIGGPEMAENGFQSVEETTFVTRLIGDGDLLSVVVGDPGEPEISLAGKSKGKDDNKGKDDK